MRLVGCELCYRLHMTGPTEDAVSQFLAGLARDSVGHILEHEDPQGYLRWVEAEVLSRWNTDPALFESRAEAVALVSSFGRAVWNAMPLPGNAFRPRPLPAPGRNDICPCGSGRKYKRCCGGRPPTPTLETRMVWPLVIKRLPKDVLKEAVTSRRIPVDVLIAAAIDEKVAGHPRKALALLQPLFEGEIEGDDEDHEYALDLVCDLYADLGYTKKKMETLEHVTQRARPSPLRSAAWQRIAAISMDRGELEKAWESFRFAQRDAPDAPALGVLEIQILMAEKQPVRARERARYWARRLRGQGWPDDEGPVEFLAAVADNPESALAELGLGMAGGDVQRLRDWLDEVASRPVPLYELARDAAVGDDDDEDAEAALARRLRKLGIPESAIAQAIADLPPAEEAEDDLPDGADADESSFLVPPTPVQKLEAAWHEVFPAGKPFSVGMFGTDSGDAWDSPIQDTWMSFLETHPEAFDSIDILDDLATAVLGHEQIDLPGFDRLLLEPVLRRARNIIDRALADAADAELSWLFVENRPPIRCLVHLLWLEQRLDNDEAAIALARFVLALNPNDNHGLRMIVINDMLRRREDERALELAERYPGDLHPEIAYGRALALFRLERPEEADAALRDALARLPKVPGFLTPKRVRRPRIDAHGIQVGGDDQAWIYREEMRDVWTATDGALEWLRKALKRTAMRS